MPYLLVRLNVYKILRLYIELISDKNDHFVKKSAKNVILSKQFFRRGFDFLMSDNLLELNDFMNGILKAI